MSDTKFYGIEKLKQDNYYNWKFKMKMYLVKEDLWSVIQEPAQDTDAWRKKDLETFAVLSLCVEDSQLIHIRNETSARNAWNKLKNQHERVTLSSKVHLMRKICSMRLGEGENMEDHINSMMELFDKLRAIGNQNFTEDWQVSMVLSSLPTSYDGLITALEVRPDKDLTMETVKGKLMEEYSKKMSRDDSSNISALKSKAMKKIEGKTCFFCKKSGHLKKECHKYQVWLKNNNKKSANIVEEVKVKDDCEFVLMTTSMKGNQASWIIDSGASCHIARDKELFSEINYNDKGQSICVANGNSSQAKGKGVCKIKIGDVSLIVNDVYYVPDFNSNLLSVRKITEKGYSVSFIKNVCILKKNCNDICKAYLKNGLYTLNATSEKVFSVHNCNKGCIHYWHRVLGHHNEEGIKRLLKDKLATDIKINECKKYNETCEICLQGKFARIPFPKESFSRSTNCFELIHSDVCGAISPATCSGYKYFVTFIDDHSRYCTLYLLKTKDEVYSKLIEFWNLVKNQVGHYPKTIRSDRGGEYIGEKVKKFLSECGTNIQYTVPYSPQQNGVAERKNRTLVEMVKCMIIDSGLKKTFWGEALMMACYIQNRLPSRSITKTPYELMYGKKPSLKDFHTFGSLCYVHVPKEKRKKLDLKAIRKVFIGYDFNSKGFRFFDPKTNKVQISRDVVFIDSEEIDNNSSHNENLDGKKNVVYFPMNSRKDNQEAAVNVDEIENEVEDQESEIEDQESLIENLDESNNFDETDDISESTIVSVESSTSNNQFSDSEWSGTGETFEDAIQSPDVVRRVSSRVNKGVLPSRYQINSATLTPDPGNFNEAISIKEEKSQWICAMQEELKSIKENNTWVLVDLPPDRKAIGCKWVFKKKLNEKGEVERFKARLVAQGYNQKFGVDYDAVFAPVVKQTTTRILFSIAGKEKMNLYHFDVKTAFLNGDLQETIYMKQPPGFISKENPNKVCLLKKSLYGLKQAARSWNQCIHKALIEFKFKQSLMDPCLYVRKSKESIDYILVYVDDMIVASKDVKFIDDIFNMLSTKFTMSNLGPVKHYLGMEVTKDKDGHYLFNQELYIKKIINEFGLQDSKISEIPLIPSYNKIEESEKLLDNKQYQKAIGSLLYLSVNTRPDITASVAILAQKTQAPTKEDWNEVKRVMKYLKGSAKLSLKLSSVSENNELFGYVDADWAENKTDRKSHSGYVFYLNGGVINWSCRKQSCVSLSTAEAEFIALSEACKEAKWIHGLLQEMHYKLNTPITIMEDNQSCIKMVLNEKFNARSKHIDIKYHFVKDYCSNNFISLKYCPTEKMIADILTKPLAKTRLLMLRTLLGLM